jgi:hypothetical protein
MIRRRTAFLLAAILLAEAVLVIAFPARVPRPVRALTAAMTLIAAAAVWLLARQRHPDR